MTICGKLFTVHFYDWYIDDAIMLAERWPVSEVTYERVLHLRNWIRENYQHDHNVPYKNIKSVRGCCRWVERVIHAEFRYADEVFKGIYKQGLEENKSIFSDKTKK